MDSQEFVQLLQLWLQRQHPSTSLREVLTLKPAQALLVETFHKLHTIIIQAHELRRKSLPELVPHNSGRHRLLG